MNVHRAAIALTIINMVLLVFLLTQTFATNAQNNPPILRARGLQIVDEKDRIRAEILVHGPETVDGTTYPDTVLFRMATPQAAPLMKLTVSEKGTATGLSDDSRAGGIELRAQRDRGDFVKIINREGREQTVKP